MSWYTLKHWLTFIAFFCAFHIDLMEVLYANTFSYISRICSCVLSPETNGYPSWKGLLAEKMRLPIVFWKKNCPVSWLICGLMTLSSKFFSMRRAFLIGIFCLWGYSLRSGLMFSENMSCLGDGLSLSLVFFPLREIESRYDLPLDCEF